MAGWISLHRSITKHWLWECEEFSKSQAWIDLILHACHKPNSLMIKGKLYKLERGQQARSMLTLSKQWKWSRGKVKRFLDALSHDSMVVQQADINTSIITICNYNSFQDSDTTDGTTDGTTNGHQTVQQTDIGRDTNNKGNKDNNGNKLSKAMPNSAKEVQDYFTEKGYGELGIGNKFVDHYESIGWMRGKAKIKCWKGTARTWMSRMSKTNQLELPSVEVREINQQAALDEMMKDF